MSTKINAPFKFTPRPWRTNENRFLEEHYATASELMLVESLGRSWSAIKTHARNLGLTRRPGKKKPERAETFTLEQIDEIRAFHSTHSNIETSQKFLIPSSVLSKMVRYFGFEKSPDFKKTHAVSLKRMPWTDKEIDVLVLMYPNHKNYDIPLHRTLGEIQRKAAKLGLKKSKQHMYILRHDFGWSLRYRLQGTR